MAQRYTTVRRFAPTGGRRSTMGTVAFLFVIVLTVCTQWILSLPGETRVFVRPPQHTSDFYTNTLAIEEYWKGTFASLTHDEKERAVTLVMTGEVSACRTPVLRGRLSGPALVVLDWVRHEKKFIGRYNVAVPGNYFLEVIVLACFEMTQNWTMQEVKEMCVADVTKHRVSQMNSSIFVTHASTHIDTTVGTWVQTAKKQLPLYTRVQPPTCSDCTSFTNMDRFAGYKFNFTERHKSANVNELKLAAKSTKLSRTCFVGASHSRTMVELLTQEYSTLVDVLHVDVRWPLDLPDASREVLTNNCSTAVVGIGQWPAGWPDNHPMSFVTYEASMRQSLREFARRTKDSGVRLFCRNTHENPLGNRISTCPPSDWRNPEVIRIYNELLSNVCRDLGIRYLVTTDITTPMWDSAEDWCHYKSDVGLVEATFILREISSFT